MPTARSTRLRGAGPLDGADDLNRRCRGVFFESAHPVQAQSRLHSKLGALVHNSEAVNVSRHCRLGLGLGESWLLGWCRVRQRRT